MEETIRERLRKVEEEEKVVIALAVESGSRAWGFPSIDSDYDVRFIYVREPGWYLSLDLERKRDVIELPIEDSLDCSGWDVRKALQLFRKSNPPLLEWLQCPIVYRESYQLAERMRELLPEFYSRKACFYHYLHMARGNFRGSLQGEEVWRKKYFYVVRPLLAIRWIEQAGSPVPMEFDQLVEFTVDDGPLRSAIGRLVEEKRAGLEMGYGPHIPAIDAFIDLEFARLASAAPDLPGAEAPIDKLNALFRDTLAEVWMDPLVGRLVPGRDA